MNKKIICFAFMVLIILSNYSAYALDASLKGDVISVSDSDMTPEIRIPLIITKPFVDADSLSDANIKSDIIFAYEIQTDSNGELNIKTRLPDGSPAGWYTVYAGEKEAQFYYATKEEISQAIEAFSKAEESDVLEIIKIYTIEKPVVWLDLDGIYSKYTSHTQKAFVLQLKECDTEIIEDIQECFERACDISMFVKGEQSEIEALLTGKYASLLDSGNNAEDVSEIFANVRDDDIFTFDSLKRPMRESNAVAALNSSSRSEVMEKVELYNDVLELNLEGKYKKCKPAEVAKVLAGQDFKKAEDVQKAFDKRVKELTEEKTSSGSSGGGSFGSSPNFSATLNNENVNKSDNENNSDINQIVTHEFKDLNECEWAEGYISALYAKGIVNGISQDVFAPSENVTREQFVKMLALAFDADLSNKTLSFDDADENAWYIPYIAWAVNSGVVNGKSHNVFGVGDYITREDMCVMAVRALESKGISLSLETLKFSDANLISEYAAQSVSKLCNEKIINGKGNDIFAPKDNSTRAETAKIIYLIMEKAGALNG
ncbi:MAG: S-layer homology domain-containing protein [Clostridia bacterium]|nr:S-layer homology domain-containing protein [Clostridia bacterium]